MKSVFFFALLSALSTISLASDFAPIDTPESAVEKQKISDQLERTIIPNYEVTNVTLQDALALIEKKAEAADPKSKPVRITMEPQMLNLDIFNGVKMTPLLITLKLNNVREGELLGYVSRLTGLNVRIKENGVRLEGCNIDGLPLVTKRYSLSPEFFGTSATSDRKCQELFDKMGVQFPPEASVHYDVKKKILTVINNEMNLDVMDQIIDSWRKEGKRPE